MKYYYEFEEEADTETEDIYNDDTIEELEEDDEITPEEEAFMRGYKEAEKENPEEEEE